MGLATKKALELIGFFLNDFLRGFPRTLPVWFIDSGTPPPNSLKPKWYIGNDCRCEKEASASGAKSHSGKARHNPGTSFWGVLRGSPKWAPKQIRGVGSWAPFHQMVLEADIEHHHRGFTKMSRCIPLAARSKGKNRYFVHKSETQKGRSMKTALLLCQNRTRSGCRPDTTGPTHRSVAPKRPPPGSRQAPAADAAPAGSPPGAI